MKWFKLFLVGLIPVLIAAVWLRGKLVDETEAVRHFCRATHGGEAWPQVQERAAKLGLEFVRGNASGQKTEEWLTWVDSTGYRFGCTVVVEDGHVVRTRDGELPSP